VKKSRREFLNETFSTVTGFGVAAAFGALDARLAIFLKAFATSPMAGGVIG